MFELPPYRPPQMSATLVPPELLNPVVAYFRPRRVILFGSVARGEAGPDSDIDLLVVVDDDTPPEKVTIRAGRESRRPYRQPADVIPVREDTWRRFSRVVGTLLYAARTEGIVVYERG
jgi:predicted nucleotidyltransferase